MISERQPDMYELVRQERNMFCRWLVLHLACVAALLLGLFFACLYMQMPDRVIILARDHTVYLGNSAPLDSPRVIEDAALRAVYALLSRRCDIRNEKAIFFAFTRRGQAQAKAYLNETQEMFEKRKIFQEVESASVETAVLNGQPHALVKGILNRRGI